MKRGVPGILILFCALSLHGQEAQRGETTAVRQRPLGRGAAAQRPPETVQQPAPEATISPEILGRIGFAVAPRPAEIDVARQGAQIADIGVLSAAPQASTPAVAVDLDAVRSRVGAVTDIRVVGEDKQTTTAGAADRAVLLRRGELMVVRRPPGAVDPAPLPGDGQTGQPVPGPEPAPADGVAASRTILYTLDDAGRTRELGLVHRSAGLHWQAETRRFTGELLVGILDRENPLASEPLGTTIPIQLLAAPGSLKLTDLQVDRIGSPFARVAVDVAIPGNPFPVEFVSQIDPDLPPARLQVFRPRLLLSAPLSIQGFGVEEAVITISGLDTTLTRDQAITLELDNGWLADQTVVVGDNGTASTRIRSDWLGRGTLRIVSPNVYDAEPKAIGYSAPVPFIAATLAGGMLGGAVLVHMLKRKSARKRRSYVTDWLIGVVIGVGATTMAYAGMKLPEWIPVPATLVGEVAPFALSFICAAAGTSLIQSIVGSREGG